MVVVADSHRRASGGANSVFSPASNNVGASLSTTTLFEFSVPQNLLRPRSQIDNSSNAITLQQLPTKPVLPTLALLKAVCRAPLTRALRDLMGRTNSGVEGSDGVETVAVAVRATTRTLDRVAL